MANLDQPRGAVAKGVPLRVNVYVAESAIYPGDLVKKNANGTVEPVSASTDACIGASVAYAASGEYCQVADHPDQLFYMQADEDDIADQDAIGLNYEIVPTAADSTYRISRMELDSDSGNTTETLPLMLMDIDRRADNEFGEFVDCVVKINNHQLANKSTGV
jgi:hypothetical protein